MSDSSESVPPTIAASAAAPVRRFRDSDGVEWQVSERSFASYDRRRGLSLIFASEGAVRRVREYPPDWHLLPDEALFALSWQA